ncbi:MAG: ROK family protein [Fimbriiglobus sp.]|jgi:glucokinase|nr:ROK family protein [Fimbriiglobus sp.]
MPAAAKFVGLDVGGTTMKAAVVDSDGVAAKAVSLDTNPERGQEAGLTTMCETIELAVKAAGLTIADIAAIGVATPGLMDIRAGLILDPPNLAPWKNVPVREHIQKAFGKPTAYQNDANAAAFGEKWVGAARGARSMVMFTLGTGVGGAVVVGDTVIEGEHSHGGELGHLRIDMPDRGRRCGCGARGCLEAYASASAVVERAREELASWRGPTELKQFQTVFDHKQFNAEVIFRLAEAGDACAAKVVDDTAYYLALGACATIAVVDPEVIVIGGGMAKSKAFLAKVDEYIRRYGLPYPTLTDRYSKSLGRADLPAPVKVVFAQLGETAGYIGAAGCAKVLAGL